MNRGVSLYITGSARCMLSVVRAFPRSSDFSRGMLHGIWLTASGTDPDAWIIEGYLNEANFLAHNYRKDVQS